MGDFLSRLAERTLETAPVAKPVIAPAFAPGIPTADQGRTAEPEEREGTALRTEEPPRHAYPLPPLPVPGEPPARHDDVAGRTRLPVAPQPLPGPAPRRADDERRVEEPRADRIPRHDAPRPAPVEVRIIEREIERRPEPRRSDSPDGRADAGREDGFLLPPIPPEPPREGRGSAGREVAGEMEIARDAARGGSDAPRERGDGAEPSPSRRRDEEAPRREPPMPRPLVAIEPQPVRPRAERLDAIPGERGRREEHPAPSQPQIIQVTIGRIEVRATTTATTRGERRERQGAQVMSIDDYLRQRTGGGR